MAIFNMVWWGGWGDSTPNYLCFTAYTTNATIKLVKYWNPTAVTLETSTDLENWSTYTFWDTITLTNVLDKVYWRNTSETDTRFSIASWDYYYFAMTWTISWSWDITTLLNKNWTNTLSGYCFRNLFENCSSLRKAPELPATTLDSYCYNEMFDGCSNLVIPPELPAKTLSSSCYDSMFSLCSKLEIAPKLPATTTAYNCYRTMFWWCTSLKEIPMLPATTFSNGCYYSMFQWCTNIKISTTQTWEYQTVYRVPTTWTGSWWNTASLYNMFYGTWWTFTGSPSANTNYYTSNKLV